MLPGETSLEIDFIHQDQKDLQTGRDANLPARGPLATNPRPYPQFSSVTLINSLTDSTYDALQAQLRKRFKGTTWQVSYTLAKAISDNTNDNASTNTDPWNTFGNDDRGLDENDRRQSLSVSAIAPLPWGIQLSTILSLRTGNPWDVTAGVDLDRDGNNQDRPAGLQKNAGGRESETNLAIINAFRASRNLAPITMEQLARTSADKVVDLRATKQFQVGAPHPLRGVPRGLQPAERGELREPERRHHVGQLRHLHHRPRRPADPVGGAHPVLTGWGLGAGDWGLGLVTPEFPAPACISIQP